MSGSQPPREEDITTPLKDANNNELPEYPPVKPEITISQQTASDNSITKEYLDAVVRIVIEIAVKYGWTAAEITYVGETHLPVSLDASEC
jgi:hypothetical protein